MPKTIKCLGCPEETQLLPSGALPSGWGPLSEPDGLTFASATFDDVACPSCRDAHYQNQRCMAKLSPAPPMRRCRPDAITVRMRPPRSGDSSPPSVA